MFISKTDTILNFTLYCSECCIMVLQAHKTVLRTLHSVNIKLTTLKITATRDLSLFDDFAWMVLMFFAIRLARLARLASEHCYTSLMSKILRLISIVSVLAQSVSFLTKHCWFLRREKKMMLNLFKVLAHKFDTCKVCGWVKYSTNRHTVGRCHVTALLNWCQGQHSPRSRVVEEVWNISREIYSADLIF